MPPGPTQLKNFSVVRFDKKIGPTQLKNIAMVRFDEKIGPNQPNLGLIGQERRKSLRFKVGSTG